MLLGKIRHKSEESFFLIKKTTKDFSIAISKIISESDTLFKDNLKIDRKTKENILNIADKLLTEYHLLSGAGFAIYNESVFESWQLTWLYRPQHHRTVNKHCLNKASQPLLDYQTFSWFYKVKEAEEGYLHGPYVDYICNSTYTLTYLYPVYLGEQLIGIAATDVRVGQLEITIREILSNEQFPIVMTTPTGRILFSNHSRYRVGELNTPPPSTTPIHSQYFTLWVEENEYGAIPP